MYDYTIYTYVRSDGWPVKQAFVNSGRDTLHTVVKTFSKFYMRPLYLREQVDLLLKGQPQKVASLVVLKRFAVY